MGCGCEVSMEPEKRKAQVHLPADSDITKFELGDDVEITIKGKIVNGRFSLEKEDWDDAKGHLGIEIDSISIEGKNIFQSLID